MQSRQSPRPTLKAYSTINTILKKDILNEVYKRFSRLRSIIQIPIRRGNSVLSFFEIPQVLSVPKAPVSRSLQVILAGSIMISDLSKRCKKELGFKSIFKVTSSTRENVQNDYCLSANTIAQCSLLDPWHETRSNFTKANSSTSMGN